MTWWVSLLAAFFAITQLSACATKKKAPAQQNLEMAKRLQQLDFRDNQSNIFEHNSQRAQRVLNRISRLPDQRNIERLLFAANQYLVGGQPDQSIQVLQRILKVRGLSSERRLKVKYEMAVAYFRMGERDNCIMHHSTESCLLPIRGKGVYTERKGAKDALKILLSLMKEDRDPKNIKKYKWLANIAIMALGQSPRQYGLTQKIDAGPEDNKLVSRFHDISKSLKVDTVGHAGGVIFDDFDNDGDYDLVVSSSFLADQIRFYENKKGIFIERTKESGLIGITGGLSIAQADYNNDGHLDFIILRGGWLILTKGGKHPNSLIRNNGDGTFTDVTVKSGLLSHNPTQTATWADFDRDGDLDLFIGNEVTKDDHSTPNWEFYLNKGDGTFEEASQKVKGLHIDHEVIKAVVTGDYDNDGHMDIFVSSWNDKNHLFKNRGSLQFEDVTTQAGVAAPIASFPAWFWDYDNDGHLDLLVSRFVFDYRNDIAQYFSPQGPLKPSVNIPVVYRNRGDGTFKDAAPEMDLRYGALSMGANFGDINNDGFLDFYMGTGAPGMDFLFPNKMFLGREGKNFVDVTTEAGLGHLQKAHGIAFADFDNDGDQDIYTVVGGLYSDDTFQNSLFENPAGDKNNWIRLTLVGVRSNRSAIGAKVKITLEDVDQKQRLIYRTVSSGGSFGANPLALEVGLGKPKKILQVRVTWPRDGLVETFESLKMNQRYRIVEGRGLEISSR